MSLPKIVFKLADIADERHPEDREKAVNFLEKEVSKLVNYNIIAKDLFRKALKEIIYDIRHRKTVRIKNQAGLFHTRAKVIESDSEGVRKASISTYNLCISGRLLGNIFGSDLIPLAEIEESKSRGYVVNSRICRKLSKIVPNNKTVRESVTEKRLAKIIEEARGETL